MEKEKTCFDCAEYTWNWQKVTGCIGSGRYSIKPCKNIVPVANAMAKKRVKALGPPGLNN